MTYAERRFDGKRTFQLFADRVVIKGSEVFSTEYEQIVRLDSLNAEFDRLRHRNRSFMQGIYMALGSLLLVSILQKGFGISIGSYLGGMAAVGVITGLLLAFATRHKVEYAVFKNHAGGAALSVARSGKQVSDYDAFLDRVVQQIQSCRQNLEPPKTSL